MPSVDFRNDSEKEYEYHELFRKHWPEHTLFAFQTNFKKRRIIKKIDDFWDEYDNEALDTMVKQWKPIEKMYFERVAKVTGVPWLHDTYYVYVLAFMTLIGGFSNPHNLKSQECVISPSSIINPKFFVAHELFHSHYYYVLQQLGLPEANKTLFTESTVDFVLFYSDIKELLPASNEESYTRHYSEVRNNWDKLFPLWQNRVDFKGFLVSALKKVA